MIKIVDKFIRFSLSKILMFKTDKFELIPSIFIVKKIYME